MTRNNITSVIILILTVTIIYFIIKTEPTKDNPVVKKSIDLKEIKERGKLIAATDYNSTNYFIYRGTPMGYQFELLNELAEYLDVKLEIFVSNDLEETYGCLQSGGCDLIALDLTVTKERSEILAFTEPYSQTRQVLVQKKPNDWKHLSLRQLEDSLIRNQLDIGGKTIYVQKGSVFYNRLMNLSDEIGDSIHVYESEYDMETLISMVAKGEIEYTIADENVALVNRTYYPEIDVKTAISFPQNLAWAVRKNADSLRFAINSWLADYKKTAKFNYIYRKYFKNKRSVQIVQSEFYSKNEGKISEYDSLIRIYGEKINWDWRLLASLIYQESRFKPNLTSWAGARGLMQLMPVTAKKFGCTNLFEPEQNISAGTKFLVWLDEYFTEIKDPNERVKFILASYNCGFGHIVDARSLAEKYGKDPNIWFDNAEYFLKQKSNPKYFRDEVVKYGYCRGEETYNFVHQIVDRYQHYKNIIEE